MVKINNSILGTPKGKLGKIVYRHMNGRTFASERPDIYNASQSEAAKSNRGRFGIAIQFAKYINSIPELSKIWKYTKIKGTTSFNRLVKYNIKTIKNCLLTPYNLITPVCKDDFAFVNDISFVNNSLKFKINLDEKVNITVEDFHILIYCIIAFQSPKRNNEKSIVMTHLSIETTKYKLNDYSEVEMSLADSQKGISSRYKSCMVYIAGIIDSQNPKDIVYTSTFSGSFDINS